MQNNLSRQLIIWALLLSLLTTFGVGYLWLNNLLPSDLSLGVIVIAYSPSLAAIFAALFTRSSRELFGQLLRWQAPWYAYLVALGLPAIAVGGAAVTSQLIGPAAIVDLAGIGIGVGAIIAGSLGEELGWRGFLQPRLSRRFTLLWASLLVGVAWATWHCWTVFAPQGLSGDWLLDAILTYLRLVPTALIYGWLYHISKRSLPLVMIAHAAHNVAINALIIPATANGFSLSLAGFYLMAAIILICVRRKDFFILTT
jgi:membrane protease YdiL (CAAX protease family)